MNPFLLYERMDFKDHEDHKGYFIFRDAIANLSQVTATLLNNYHCGAGCSICYVKDQWLPLKEVKTNSAGISPDVLTKRYEAISRNFDYIELMDDPALVKSLFPDLYPAFIEIAKGCLSPSISNNNIIRFTKLLDELRYRKIDQISVSDLFLLKRGPKVIEALDKLCEVYGKVESIRIIPEGKELVNDLRIPEYLNAFRTFTDRVNYVGNIFAGVGTSTDKGGAQITQEVDNVEDGIYAENGIVHLIYENSLHTSGDNFYLRTEEVIDSSKVSPVSSLYAPPLEIILNNIKAKLRHYKNSASVIEDKSTLHFRYYDWLSKNVSVNDACTFIPSPMVNESLLIFQNLIKDGWIKTPQGLLSPFHGGHAIGPLEFTDGHR